MVNSLNIQVCPFCNRQYITSWNDSKKNKPTADLDHFFPKTNYPLFELCLFNFVPSCQICNTRMKKDDLYDENGNRPIYPYDENFDDSVVFRVDVSMQNSDEFCLRSDEEKKAGKLLNIWLGQQDDGLRIILDYGQTDDESVLTEYQTRVKRSNELFHLEEVYQAHRGFASDLLLKKRIYDNGEYLKSLENIFKGFKPNLFGQSANNVVCDLIGTELNFTYKQLEIFLYGYNWENGQDEKRPLSKLTYDILMRFSD